MFTMEEKRHFLFEIVEHLARIYPLIKRNKSVSGFDEPMLKIVVQRRTDELKKHPVNPSLSQEEIFRTATVLVQVGIELFLMAVECGPKYRHLWKSSAMKESYHYKK